MKINTYTTVTAKSRYCINPSSSIIINPEKQALETIASGSRFEMEKYLKKRGDMRTNINNEQLMQQVAKVAIGI